MREHVRAMHPTPYDDVNLLLDELLSRIREVLGGKLVGLYLFGSLTTGDFDPGISDVDLLAAISSDLSDAEFKALDAMHRYVAREHPDWDDRIEVLYLSMHGLKTFRTERSPIAVVSPGEAFNLKDAGNDWLTNWYNVRERGVVLFGPPAHEIIGPITINEFAQTVREYVPWLADNVWEVRSRKYQAYVILTMCRALYLHRTGGIASKKKAAAWARRELPEWSGLIEDALAWREAWREEQVDHDATFVETARFVKFVRGQIVP